MKNEIEAINKQSNYISNVTKEIKAMSNLKSIKERLDANPKVIVYVVKSKQSGKFITVNTFLSDNIERATAFDKYEDAKTYADNFMKFELSVAKVNLATFYEEDTDSDTILEPFTDNPNPQEMAMEDAFNLSRGK